MVAARRAAVGTLSQVHLRVFSSIHPAPQEAASISLHLVTPTSKGDRAHWKAAFLRAACRVYFCHKKLLYFSVLLSCKLPEYFLPLCLCAMPPFHARHYVMTYPAPAGLCVFISCDTSSVHSFSFSFPCHSFLSFCT